MPDQVPTIKDVPGLLQLAQKSVYGMARAGGIPACEGQGLRPIKRSEVGHWIDAQPRGGDGGGCGD